MENARVITLAPTEGDPSTMKIVTFDEEFDEYSNFKGRGRERRAKRKAAHTENKMARIKSKNERKVARQTMRGDRRDAKKLRRGDRKQGRIDRRLDHKDSRITRRQDRKTFRKQSRLDRRAMGDEMAPEENYDEGYDENMPQDNYGNDDSGSDTGSNTGYDDTGSDTGSDAGYDDTGSDTGSDAGYDDSGSGSDDGYSQEEYPQDENGYEDEEGSGDSGDEESDTYGEDEPVDYGDEAFNDEYGSQFSGEANNGTAKLNPEVKDKAMKIEWNKEMYNRLNDFRTGLVETVQNAETQPVQDKAVNQLNQVDDKMNKCNQRVAELEQWLANYINTDFAQADGNNNSRRKRMGQVAAAKRVARNARLDVIKSNQANKVQAAKINRMHKKGHGGSETPVSAELDPNFGANRIEIPPAMSNADGPTGLIALDEAGDFGEPDALTYEVQSSADGNTRVKISPVDGLLYITLAGAFVWGMRELLKK